MKNYPLTKTPKLFSNCIPIKGYLNSIICDLQRELYYPIPNDLYDLLTELENSNFENIISHYGIDNETIIYEYIDFLTEHELIQFLSTSDYDRFPKMELMWESPSIITNAVIHLDINNILSLQITFAELQKLGCKNLELIVNVNNELGFEKILKHLSNYVSESKFSCINITSNFIDIDYLMHLDSVIWLENRLGVLIIYNAPHSKVLKEGSMNSVYLIKQNIFYPLSCGQVSLPYLHANVPLFTEAQQHNTCLNRKISIDVNGEIKNCPSMAKSYGNIKDTTLAEAIEKPGFKDLWFINKDKIHVCKDCEFRYICTDCRAYIENPEDIYSKPLKCGYNPYTAEWEEWSTNPLKQKAIEFYGMQDLVKKDN